MAVIWSEEYLFVGGVIFLLSGMILLAIGTRVVQPRVTRSAGAFDLGLGAVLLLVGVFELLSAELLWVPTYPALFVGLYLFREYYVLADERERRVRDAVNLVLLGGPVTLGFLPDTNAVGVSVYGSMFLSGVAGLGLLCRDGIRWLSGDEVYRRDIVAELVMVCQLPMLLLVILIAMSRMPP